MMNTMNYKGYTARIDYDDADNIFVGRVLGILDIVSFHAESVAELSEAFHESVDDYEQACEKLGQPAQKPASGKLMLRVAPEVHRAALIAAQASGVSLNQWAAKVLQQATAHTSSAGNTRLESDPQLISATPHRGAAP